MLPQTRLCPFCSKRWPWTATGKASCPLCTFDPCHHANSVLCCCTLMLHQTQLCPFCSNPWPWTVTGKASFLCVLLTHAIMQAVCYAAAPSCCTGLSLAPSAAGHSHSHSHGHQQVTAAAPASGNADFAEEIQLMQLCPLQMGIIQSQHKQHLHMQILCQMLRYACPFWAGRRLHPNS